MEKTKFAFMLRNAYIVVILSVFFLSCEKKDKPITLPPKGNGKVVQVNMGSKYEQQFYVSIENQKIVLQSRNDSWDLAFQSSTNGSTIFLNGGQRMCAYPTQKTNFSNVTFADTNLIANNWVFDAETGEKDSTALKNWDTSEQVYIVKIDAQDNTYKKLKILSVDEFQYIIQVGDLNASTPIEKVIIKDELRNHTYFSLHTMTTVQNVEPEKADWDIKFCTYNHTFYEITPILPYTVVGCLLNPNNTKAYKDSVSGYNNIVKEGMASFPLSSKLNTIGYDWKKIDFQNSSNYYIDNRYSFIIQTQNNRYFKLRFLDFYSPTGEKGSPKFEFVEL